MHSVTDASSAYFAWKHYHPREAEDIQAVWGAAWRAGGRAALTDSSRLVDLVPLLRDLLDALDDERIEHQLRTLDRRPRWDDDEEPF
jgi:hypothetical protein